MLAIQVILEMLELP